MAGRSNDNSNNNNITTTTVYDTKAVMGPVGPTVAQPPAEGVQPRNGPPPRARSSRPDQAGQESHATLGSWYVPASFQGRGSSSN